MSVSVLSPCSQSKLGCFRKGKKVSLSSAEVLLKIFVDFYKNALISILKL